MPHSRHIDLSLTLFRKLTLHSNGNACTKTTKAVGRQLHNMYFKNPSVIFDRCLCQSCYRSGDQDSRTILLFRSFPTVEKQARIYDGDHYQQLPQPSDFAKLFFNVIGLSTSQVHALCFLTAFDSLQRRNTDKKLLSF